VTSGQLTRRGILGTALGVTAGAAAMNAADAQPAAAELILHRARITTLEPGAPDAKAVAIADAFSP
jgi:hypothetical protein